MILLGVVLLLTTMHVLQPQPLLRWFGTYWPALIILWGVIKLVEYQQAKNEGTRPAGIGAGGVLLLIFLIMFGMSATQASRLNWDEIRDRIDLGGEEIALFGHNYSYDDQLQQDFPAGGSLHIVERTRRGQCECLGRQPDSCGRAQADQRRQPGGSGQINPATKPQINVSGNDVTLNAQYPGRRVTTRSRPTWTSVSPAKRQL